MLRPRAVSTPILAPTRGIRASVDCVSDDGAIRAQPISSRSQAANDAHALAIIQWHTNDKLFYGEAEA